MKKFTEEEERRIQEAVEEDRRKRHEEAIQEEIRSRIIEDRKTYGYDKTKSIG